MVYILGLDLGTASLGWALIKDDEANRSIIKTGVRIFPEALEGKSEEAKKPKNTGRRNHRHSRRQNKRTKIRKEEIKNILAGADLLPSLHKNVLEKPSDNFSLKKSKNDKESFISPYILRKMAIAEKLSPYDLGRVFFHLSRRIGFQGAELKHVKPNSDSSDKTKEEKEQEKDEKNLIVNINNLKKEIGDRTLGAYLADQDTQRRQHLSRDMITNEFERIWAAQKNFHPDLLTDDLKSAIHEKIFSRAPVFWRWKTLGICEYEPDSPILHKSDWLAQQFIMLQDLNNLKLFGGNQAELDETERSILFPLFQKNEKVTFATMRKELAPYWEEKGIPTNTKFNFEMGADNRKELSGNATETMLIKVFGNDFPSHPLSESIRNNIAQRKWNILYSETYKGFHPNYKSKRIEIHRANEIKEARNEFIENSIADWNITKDQAEQLADYALPKSWMRFSRKAIQSLINEMQNGTGMTHALDKIYPRADRLSGENASILPSHHRHLSNISNPVVTRCLNEVRKVVNNIIRCYGKPDFIRIELARDIKLAGKKKRNALKINKTRKVQRNNARKFLEDNEIPVTDITILKYMLWEETKRKDIYSGDIIGCDDLFRKGKYQIEHIMPKSRSRDDSFNNFILCRVDYNKNKGNKTPFEAFGNTDEWDDMVKRANETLPKNSPKIRRFLRQLYDASEERSQAQLNDTAYAAREARDFLACLYPKGEAIDWQKGTPPRVQAINSQITSRLAKA